MSKLVSKKVSESATHDHTHLLFPNDLNAIGTAFGGRVVEIADRVASIVARRHSGKSCVTLLIDSLRFLGPAIKGEALVFKSAVNRVWNTSMEVGVKVLAENLKTGEQRQVASAYFTFVAINSKNKPVKIIQVVPETEEEKRRYHEADERRQERLRHCMVRGCRNKKGAKSGD